MKQAYTFLYVFDSCENPSSIILQKDKPGDMIEGYQQVEKILAQKEYAVRDEVVNNILRFAKNYKD